MGSSLASQRATVALLADSSARTTGIGRYADTLYTGLRQAGVDVVQVGPRPPTLPSVSYQALHLLGRDLRAFLRNYPLWSTYPEADVYHFTTQTLASLLLFSRPKGRVVVTVHDIFPYMLRTHPRLRPAHPGDRLYHRLAMVGLTRADHLIADSQYTKDCIVEHLGVAADKITVVYLGVDHERFRPLAPAKFYHYQLAEGRRYVLYVGSEDPRKNLITLVRAVAKLRQDLPDVELIKVGRSDFNQERQQLIALATQLGIRRAIHFLEDVPEDDLPLLYNLAEAYITPSLYEGFGFPVLEAMACGTPVVCTNAGSLPELVGSAGVQVGACDVDALAGALFALLSNTEQRLALGRSGQSRAANFKWTATTHSTAAVYRQLMGPMPEVGASSHGARRLSESISRAVCGLLMRASL